MNKHAGSTPEQEERRVKGIATLIRGSWRWRMVYLLFKFVMLLESIAWTVMDLLRAWRMRLAARISDNYNYTKHE